MAQTIKGTKTNEELTKELLKTTNDISWNMTDAQKTALQKLQPLGDLTPETLGNCWLPYNYNQQTEKQQKQQKQQTHKYLYITTTVIIIAIITFVIYKHKHK